MTRLGVAITSVTVAWLVVGYFRSRRYRRFPVYGWLGILALFGAEGLMLRGVEPIATFFTPIAWSSYILVADGAVLALTNSSRLHDTPTVLGRMALLSIPLWLVFEGYNLRLRDWVYTGVPLGWTGTLLGYGWSFATITPAMFETSDLVQALLPPVSGKPWKISTRAENYLIALGIVCLAVPLTVPRQIAAYFSLFVWIGFVLALDPINKRMGLPSFLGDLSKGLRSRVYSFFLAGWTCGWLWEFWNNWAAAKWHYIFPIAQQWKIFEMPAPGYLGFLPFALECFVMYVTAAWLAGWVCRAK